MASALAEVLALGLLVTPGQARAAPSEAPSPGAEVALQLVPLEAPGAVVVKAEATERGTRIQNRILVPPTPLSFGQQGRYEFGVLLGGAPLTFSLEGKNFRVLSGEHRILLQRQGMGFAPITVRTAGDRDYVLAFPMGYVYQNGGVLWPRSGGVQRGSIGNEAISFYDDNTDGRYIAGEDSVRVGTPDAALNVFAPISKYLATASQVLEITSLAEDGSVLRYAPHTGPIAKLATTSNLAGVQVIAAIASDDAKLNLVATADPDAGAVERTVLPGKYRLQYGALYSREAGGIVALVVPGNMPPVTLEAGQSARLELGSPVQLEFALNKPARGRISIDSSTFKFKGKAGEEYRSIEWVTQSPPTVSAARGTTVVPLGKMSFG